METSQFIAKIFGLCYLVAGAGMLINREAYQEVMEDFCKNAALILYGGMLALVIGVVMILTHNVWASNWTVIITIIGWIAFIKGIWMIVFPNSVSSFMKAYTKNKNLLLVHSIAALVFGVIFTYLGFFA